MPKIREITVRAQDVIPTISALDPEKLARSLFLYEYDGNPPPICLKEVESGFYIIDGHHRTAVRRINNDALAAVVLEHIDECSLVAPDEGELDFMLHQFAFVSAQNLHKLDDRPIDALITPYLVPRVLAELGLIIAAGDDYTLHCAHRAAVKMREWFGSLRG